MTGGKDGTGMAIFRSELSADGKRDERFHSEATPRDAALQAIRAWRSDARLDSIRVGGEDDQGRRYTHYSFLAPGRRAAGVDIFFVR